MTTHESQLFRSIVSKFLDPQDRILRSTWRVFEVKTPLFHNKNARQLSFFSSFSIGVYSLGLAFQPRLLVRQDTRGRLRKFTEPVEHHRRSATFDFSL